MIISGKKIRLRDKKLSDAENDYAWQTDPELSRLDAVAPLNFGFPQYFRAYESELHFKSRVRRQFAIETPQGKHIGNCVYYDINESKREAELGIMIGDREYWSKGYGTDAVRTLLGYLFGKLKFKRIYLKTLHDNYRAQNCFTKCGFSPCGKAERDGHKFLLMEITFTTWHAWQTELMETEAR